MLPYHTEGLQAKNHHRRQTKKAFRPIGNELTQTCPIIILSPSLKTPARPPITNPRMTKEGKMDCPDGFFAYDLCCRYSTEETEGLYSNILNYRFSTSKLLLLRLCPNSVLSFSLGRTLPCLLLNRDYCCQGLEVGFSFLVIFWSTISPVKWGNNIRFPRSRSYTFSDYSGCLYTNHKGARLIVDL